MGIGLKRGRFLFQTNFVCLLIVRQWAFLFSSNFSKSGNLIPAEAGNPSVPCKPRFGSFRILIISLLIVLCSVSEASCYQTANIKGDALSVATDAANPDIVTLRNAAGMDGLQLTVQQGGASGQGTPMEFNVVLRDEKGRTFRDPMAMISVNDHNNTATQRLYVILKNTGKKSDTKYVVGELTLHMDRLQDKSGAVVPGRIFRLPVHSDFKQAALSIVSGNRLYVSIKEQTKYPGLPMTMVFDISPGSKDLDPIKVLLPPKH